MNATTILSSPFVTVALPLLIGMFIASWLQNKRFDDLHADLNRRFAEVNRRIDELLQRLERIEKKLDNHNERIVTLEERTSPLRR